MQLCAAAFVNNRLYIIHIIFTSIFAIYFVQDCCDLTTFADSAVCILHIFANNLGTKRDILLQ